MKLDTRTVMRIAIAVAALGYLAFTHFAKTHDGAGQESAQAAPIPANAKAFTLGTLAFKACELAQKHSGATTSAFCAPFSVTENRAATKGRQLDLRLALIKSDAVAADSDIVVFLAGGPGQSAIDTWPQVAAAFAPLLAHHHVLLLDQRGTGGSNVLECKGDDTDKGGSGSAAGFDAARTKQRTRECLDQISRHADPRFYTTIDAVADLEAVRQALGAPQFDLVGVSYGTRMAQQYAMRHADGVRSIVLDSVAPNEIALGQDFAENLDNALKLQFAQCEKMPACKNAFGDSYASLMKLRDALREHPQDYSYRDPVTFAQMHKHLNDNMLAGLVRMFAYTPETATLLPLSIAEGLKGDYTPLAGQNAGADRRHGRPRRERDAIVGDLQRGCGLARVAAAGCGHIAGQQPRRRYQDCLRGLAARNASGRFPRAAESQHAGLDPGGRIRSGHAAALRRAGAEEPGQCAPDRRQGPGPQRDRPRLHAETGRRFRRQARSENARRQMH